MARHTLLIGSLVGALGFAACAIAFPEREYGIGFGGSGGHGGMASSSGGTTSSGTSGSSSTSSSGTSGSSGTSTGSSSTTGSSSSGDAGGCAHDLCLSGVALDPACDPCVALSCAAPHDYCCTNPWTTVPCVSNLGAYCPAEYAHCIQVNNCAHSPCVVGAPLFIQTAMAAGSQTFDACGMVVYRVCVDSMMPSCCTGGDAGAPAWTQACVDAAKGWGLSCP